MERLARIRDAHRERDRQQHDERRRRSGKRVLDANAIAVAAVAIADAQGVAEVSMRRIAAVLGSGTMSLYHYVRTKEDLFALMDDLIMGEILVGERDLKGGWRQAMTAIATHTRDTYRRHPWALTMPGRSRTGSNHLRHVEQSLAALTDSGLGFKDRMTIIIVTDDFVFGHMLRASIQDLQGGQDMQGAVAEASAGLETLLASGDYPELTAMMDGVPPGEFLLRMAKTFDEAEWFETGLDAVLDGLAKRFNLDR